MPVRERPNKPIPPTHRGLAGLVFPGAVGTRSTLLHHHTSYFALVALRARDNPPLAHWACGGNWGLKSEFHKYDCGGRVVFVGGWICYCLWLSPKLSLRLRVHFARAYEVRGPQSASTAPNPSLYNASYNIGVLKRPCRYRP
jgi:hypothetical protein